MERKGRHTFLEQWLAPKPGEAEGLAMGGPDVERYMGAGEGQGPDGTATHDVGLDSSNPGAVGANQ